MPLVPSLACNARSPAMVGGLCSILRIPGLLSLCEIRRPFGCRPLGEVLAMVHNLHLPCEAFGSLLLPGYEISVV